MLDNIVNNILDLWNREPLASRQFNRWGCENPKL